MEEKQDGCTMVKVYSLAVIGKPLAQRWNTYPQWASAVSTILIVNSFMYILTPKIVTPKCAVYQEINQYNAMFKFPDYC